MDHAKFTKRHDRWKTGEGKFFFPFALKAGLLLFYVITKDRAATFSDIEIFL